MLLVKHDIKNATRFVRVTCKWGGSCMPKLKRAIKNAKRSGKLRKLRYIPPRKFKLTIRRLKYHSKGSKEESEKKPIRYPLPPQK